MDRAELLKRIDDLFWQFADKTITAAFLNVAVRNLVNEYCDSVMENLKEMSDILNRVTK